MFKTDFVVDLFLFCTSELYTSVLLAIGESPAESAMLDSSQDANGLQSSNQDVG